MKYRDSGMPNEEMRDTFFTPIEIINKMNINNQIKILIDIGCGYGTFLLPMSKLIRKKAIGIDIDVEMINVCRNKVQKYNIENIDLIKGDISTNETLNELKKYTGEIDYISLFNILHCEEPINLLENVYKLLNDNGKIGVIHWKYEKTPRGPSMEIRPRPEMIINWATKIGFKLEKQVELPPYHYGLVFTKVTK